MVNVKESIFLAVNDFSFANIIYLTKVKIILINGSFLPLM